MHESYFKLPAGKREAIQSIGMRFFTQYGYAQSNTVEIAKACGIAKGSLFHYFESKKGFFLFLVSTCAEQMVRETGELFSSLTSEDYFERLHKGVEAKISLPLRFPAEIAFLTKAFSETESEAGNELRVLAGEYAREMGKLSQTIGKIERERVRQGVDYDDACVFIQTVLDGLTTRLLRQYALCPEKLLSNMDILTVELDKTIGFILLGVGRGEKL